MDIRLDCTIEYLPDSASDAVPWRYMIADDAGTSLGYGWAPSRAEAEARARRDADAIRNGVMDKRPAETFPL